MDKKLFKRLVESMDQMNEIVRGERTPSREFYVDDNIDILRRILSLLEDYSFEDDVSLEENILLKRLQTKVNTMMEDYVEDFKA